MPASTRLLSRAGVLTDLSAQVDMEGVVIGLVDEIGLPGPLVVQGRQYPGETLTDVGEVHRLVAWLAKLSP